VRRAVKWLKKSKIRSTDVAKNQEIAAYLANDICLRAADQALAAQAPTANHA